MAGRKSRKTKKMKLAQMPTQRVIACSAGEASQTAGVVEVAPLLSQMNSRLYRQGMVYDVQVALTEPISPTVPYQLNIYTLPNNWFTHGAIKEAFSRWRSSLQDELVATGGKHSKWLDFTIQPDADGSPGSNVFYPNFWDGNSHTAVSTGYKQGYSEVTDSDGDVMKFNTGGAEDKSGAGVYNVMLEFARHIMSRRADDTAESGPQAYEGLQAGLDEMDHILEDGDTPPWDQDYGMWHGAADADSDTRLVWADTLVIGIGNDSDDTAARTAATRLVSRTIQAPLGLLFLEANAAFAQSSDSEFAVIAKPGKYKGVSAAPIFHHDLLGATAKSLR